MITPKNTKSNSIIGFQISFKKKSFDSFKVFMADKVTTSSFNLHKRNMLGDGIDSGTHRIRNYKVKVSETENLEDDPKNPCIDYTNEGEYDACLQSEVLRQNSQFINCTPPWMTENEFLWCKEKYQFGSYELLLNYVGFLHDIGISDIDPGKCLTPCKTKIFLSKELGFKRNDDESGVKIDFEKVVEITKSEFQVSPKILISGIGGFIGICKEFFWVLILPLTVFGRFLSK